MQDATTQQNAVRVFRRGNFLLLAATLSLLLFPSSGWAAFAIFPQQAPQLPAPTEVIGWKEGGPGAETLHLPNLAAIKTLTANGMVVAAAVDHAAGDVDLWYGKSILRVQVKVTNTTRSPVPFDPLAIEVRDSEHLLAPLSFSDVLKLAAPSQAAGLSPSGPGVYNPGTAGPGAPEQPDMRRETERAHAVQAQPQRVDPEIAVARRQGQSDARMSASRKALGAFYAARSLEPGQFLIGFLYFKAPKLSKEFVLRIPVGQTVYEIPFTNPK